MKQKKNKKLVIYSTNPDFKQENEDTQHNNDIIDKNQKLEIYRQKYKGGKVAIVIEKFIGNKNNLKALSNILKYKCGVGGTAKNGKIIIQGDIREKIITILESEGYKYKRIGG
tara:strand:+ start:35335 stop:35673 length:339 start_codon:yes stop_codon:yes gene_type:complete